VFFIVLSSTRVCFIVKRSAIALSTPLTNYSIHMDQQQQQINQAHSNWVNSPHVILTRSDSTSTVILNEAMHVDQIHLPASLLVNRSVSLRSLLKTSGLFNKGELIIKIKKDIIKKIFCFFS
jgi:hypothetical protein